MNIYRTFAATTTAMSVLLLTACGTDNTDAPSNASAENAGSQEATSTAPNTTDAATDQTPTIANDPDRKLKSERNDAGDIIGKVGQEFGYCNQDGMHCNVVFMATQLAPVDAAKCESEALDLKPNHKLFTVRTEIQGNVTTPEQNPLMSEGLTKDQFTTFNQDFGAGFQTLHTWTALGGDGVTTPRLESVHCPSVAEVSESWGTQALRLGSKIRTADVYQVPEDTTALYLTSVENPAARWKFEL